MIADLWTEERLVEIHAPVQSNLEPGPSGQVIDDGERVAAVVVKIGNDVGRLTPGRRQAVAS